MENNIQENVLYDKHGKIHMLKDYDKDDNTAVNRLLEAESKDNDKNLRSYVLSKQSIYKNLAVLSISFLLLFSAFLSLQNLQSSLNIAEGLGTIGLSCVYGSLFVSSLFLPAFMLSKLGMKWTMVLSIITYLGYIAASFHAVWETIVPTSILLGLGGANLWSAKMAYISELAKHYSSVTSMASSVATDKLFGVFFAIYHTGLFILYLVPVKQREITTTRTTATQQNNNKKKKKKQQKKKQQKTNKQTKSKTNQ